MNRRERRRAGRMRIPAIGRMQFVVDGLPVTISPWSIADLIQYQALEGNVEARIDMFGEHVEEPADADLVTVLRIAQEWLPRLEGRIAALQAGGRPALPLRSPVH